MASPPPFVVSSPPGTTPPQVYQVQQPPEYDGAPTGFSPAQTEEPLPWWKRYRAVEWVVTIVILIILVVVGNQGPVRCRAFTWGDGTLNHPFLRDTFPSWSLFPIAALPVVVYAPITLLFPVEEAHRFEQTSSTLLMHLTAITLAELFVEPSKLIAGRQRPDFLNRLRSSGVVAPTTLDDFENTVYYYCNVTTAEVREGRKSFPSGHSSTTFASMLALSLFLIHRLGAFRRGSLVRLIMGGLPMILAFVVAISRTWDYHHHHADILAGSLLGSFAALISFKLFFEASQDTSPGCSAPLGDERALTTLKNPAECVPKFAVRRRREQLDYVI